ncbi:MAG TPA: N-acetylmuramoyl-L-alanine amidase, partial [Lachnospiraceae bacterium]|nr:N-acetylmuramoyl-L-alanine amidase [Lachnospiraceae bacterium]
MKKGSSCLTVKAVFIFMTSMLLLAVCANSVWAYDNVTIVIDPGHGGPGTEDASDLGAQYHNVLEKDLALITAMSMKIELEQYGNVTVYLTRAEDKQMSLKERVDYAAALGADVIVSLHYNASTYHRFYGAEIFTSAFGQNYATGYGLAQCVMKQWTANGAVDKGIKTRLGDGGEDYYGLIRRGTEVQIPTIILEHGYIDNDIDWDRIGDAAAWQYLGQLDADGIADYFGLLKSVVQVSVSPSVSVEVPLVTVYPDTTPPSDVKVTIDQYDTSTNQVSFTVYAKEQESSLMYFGAATEQEAEDEDSAFMDLDLWDSGESSMSGTYTVPAGYEGSLIIRVYNNYELYADSEPAVLPSETTESVQTEPVSSDTISDEQESTVSEDEAGAAGEAGAVKHDHFRHET